MSTHSFEPSCGKGRERAQLGMAAAGGALRQRRNRHQSSRRPRSLPDRSSGPRLDRLAHGAQALTHAANGHPDRPKLVGGQRRRQRPTRLLPEFGGGLDVAHKLAEANIITNKNLIPGDKPEDWDRPSGLRIGTIEVTRLGLKEDQMADIAEFIARVLVKGESTEAVQKDVLAYRTPLQTFYYNFDNGWPRY